MFSSTRFLPKIYQKAFIPHFHFLSQVRSINFKRENELAPKIPVLEAVKEKIKDNGGFSEEFKTQVCMSMIFQGYGTNASLLHAILDLGFSPHLLYVASKPHTTNVVMRNYFKKIGVRYFDFSDYSYRFPTFKQAFSPGTYPAGYYYDAVAQYYNVMINAQRQDLLRNKRYPKVKYLAVVDEGAKYEQELEKVKEKFKNYRIVALAHSTSDLSGESNESLSYPKISMGGAAIKTIIEAEEIAHANLMCLEKVLSDLSSANKQEIQFGVLGCGNIGQHTIRELLETGNNVFYSDINSCQYEKLRVLSEKYPTQLKQANSTYDLFQNADIILSCVGQDVTESIHYSLIESRKVSRIKHKLFFNFASGEKEFGTWIRQSQDKEKPVIVDPSKGKFPDHFIETKNKSGIIIKFSGMPANMMKSEIHGLPPEKAQIIRGLKLWGIYQLDKLINEITPLNLINLYRTGYLKNYIQLDAWGQRFILKEYFQDLEKYHPENKEKHAILLNKLHIHTIEKLSNGIAQASMSMYDIDRNKNAIWNSIIYNKFYVQRKKHRSEIDDCFLEPYQGTLSCTLYGIAGAGKTQIARQYFIENCQKYDVAFYFNAENTEELVEQYVERLKKVQRNMVINNANDTINCFIRWIEEHSSSLLVYDNVENHKELEKMLPNIGRHRILITSRTENGINRVEVPHMTPHEAHSLLKNILQYQVYKGGDLDQIPALIQELHYLPLAIAQAGAMITDKNNSFTLTQYLEKYRENKALLFTSKKNLPWHGAAHQSIYITWFLIKEKLQKTHLPWEYVLQVMSMLSPNNMSQQTIEEKAINLIYIRGNKYNHHLFKAGLICYITSTFFLLSGNTSISLFTAFLSGITLFITDKFLEKYHDKKTIELKEKIHVTLEKLLKLGLIYKINSSAYSIHRLTQDILVFEFKNVNIKVRLGKIEILSKEIDFYFDNKIQNKNNAETLIYNAACMLEIFDEINEILCRKNYSHEYYIEKQVGNMSSDNVYSVTTGLKGIKFYNEIFKEPIKLSFQLIRLFLSLGERDKCKFLSNKTRGYITDFYDKLITSDKVLFFFYIREVYIIIIKINQHLDGIKEKDVFLEELLRLDRFPDCIEMPINKIAYLDRELKNYIQYQKEKIEASPAYLYYHVYGRNRKIDAAKWLLENCPLPSEVSTFKIYDGAISSDKKLLFCTFPALNEYKKEILSGKLNCILKKYYPLILIDNTEEMLDASIKWWIKQKNVNKESPFDLKGGYEQKNIISASATTSPRP